MSIHNVALAGATGNLGPTILENLVSAGFKVTVLSRDSSKATLPKDVKSVTVDYGSVDSLTKALTGQDAVVSNLNSSATDAQLHLIQAAQKTGVKRFLPSEFGSDTMNEKCRALPFYASKITVQDALIGASQASDLSYTLVINGLFLDWGVKNGFIVNLKEKKVTYYDSPDKVFSTTTLDDIGKAVVGVLKHPDETKNRAVYVNTAAVSLKQLVEAGKKVVGADGWTEETVPIAKIEGEAWAELQKPQPNPGVFAVGFIRTTIWGDGYGGHYPKTDNELLGVQVKSAAEVEKMVKEWA